MRKIALAAAFAVTAVTFAGAATPAAAEDPLRQVTLEAGLNNHHNTATVTYQRLDEATTTARITYVFVSSGTPDCAWVQWNDPTAWDGWSNINSEPSCNGIAMGEPRDLTVHAPAGHVLKVRLHSSHLANDVIHKDIEKL